MNAKELRIGNYVNLKDKGIYKIDRGYDLEKIEDWEGTDYCTPVCLCFEDFQSIDEDDFLADKTGFVIFKNSYAYQFVYEDYKYAHLLQNLYFSLTNKELNINK